MPLDPVLAADTRAWLRKAAIDLRGAEADLAAAPPIREDAVFHCQQAAEKALKGFLTYHQQPFGKTHDLRDLSRKCLEIDPALEPTLEPAIPLTWYAWKFRYPGAPEEPTPQESDEAWMIAGRLVQAILDRLPEEARP
jgi:HEPN domain-containing protein